MGEPSGDRSRPPLLAMLEARSVAVVGASTRPGSFGETMMLELGRGAFDGRVHPINPRYEDVLGRRCHPSLADLPEAADHVMLGVPNDRLEEQLRAAADAGARSATIFASGYEPAEPGGPTLIERLTDVARQAGMAICGGNCMGYFNLDRGLRVTGFAQPEGLRPGPVTFISHSGSAFAAMLHNDRGVRFNLVVSAGQEFVTTSAEYLDYALDQPTTKVAALFVEAVRQPDAFRAALAKAAERDIPVVILKVGRTERTKELIAAHSGALAGEDGAHEALFESYGVLRVDTLDEMLDTIELFVAGRRARRGGLAAIHDSGGERALLVDAAAAGDVPLARISDQTRERLAAVLEEGLPPVNPLDAWGTGNRAEDIFIECMHALLDDPDTAALAFCVDLTTELVEESGYTRVANEVFGRTGKPVAVLTNVASAIDPRDAGFVRRAGIPVLEGTTTGLAAFRHLFAYRDFRARSAIDPPPPIDGAIVERWRERLASAEPFAEADGLALLADFGVPVATTVAAASEEEAVSAADALGGPVALKTAEPGITHKTDVGGVRLGLDGPDAVRAAYRDLAGRLGPRILVSAMAPAGVELALGVVRDPQFGPMVVVGAGGVLVETLRDRRLALPPIDAERARAMLDRLSIRPLLQGARAAKPIDVDAVCGAIVAVSRLAMDLGDHLDALDANPLIAGPDGCVAVDALVIPRAPTTERGTR